MGESRSSSAPPQVGVDPHEDPPMRVDRAPFDAPHCRNCGAALTTPFCAQCGQKKVARLGLRDIGRETWERVRLFELGPLRTAWTLMIAPGRVAREYVSGMRVRHFHPLKLLLVVVAALLLALTRANYLQSADFGEVTRAMALVAAYGKWNFSLGILAILAASLLVFPRRLGYNPTEHLVLAAYTHAVIIVLILVNLLPTLFGASTGFVHAHREASSYYLFVVKAAVVALAFAQFFRIDLRREWWRLAAAVIVYLVASWALSRGFAHLVLWYVLRQS